MAVLSGRRDRILGLDEAAPTAPGTGRAYAFFVVAALFYVLHQFLTRGGYLLSGSMWAEMATNYYVKAQSDSVLDQLFATDAGYIPLPQRIIAMAGHELGMTPGAVPYLYTGTAVVLGAVLIATVCLPAFRPVVSSDGLRLVLALTLMLAPDFETRTFINVTYFAVVPLVAVTALAAVQRDSDVPGWAWVLPLFMLSKPAVLAALPAMLLVALISRPRFRLIALVSAVVGAVQVVQLFRSALAGGTPLQASDESALSKLIAAVKYTLGFAGRLVLAPSTTLGPGALMLAGGVFLLLCLAGAVFLRSRASALVGVGVALLFFTMLVDAFTFAAAFGRDMAMLATPGFDRRLVGAVVGVLMALTGLVAMVAESPRTAALVRRFRPAGAPRATRLVATAVLAAWVLAVGWVPYAVSVNQPLAVQYGNASQWQRMSPVMAGAEPVVCIPLNPYGWVGGRGCVPLSDIGGTPATFEWQPPSPEGDGWELDLPVPRTVQDAALASVAVMVRPPDGVESVSARAVITQDDDRETVLAADAELPAEGGVLQFYDVPAPLLADVRSVRLVFDSPVEVAVKDASDDDDASLALWLGLPR